MSPTSSINSAAVLILQQSSPLFASSEPRKSPGDDLIAAANGAAPRGGAGGSQASTQARAKISEALFSASSVSITEMKINLMRRLGEEFGISLDDHASQLSFGTAIKDAVARTRLLEDGEQILAKIEKNLGLDKLGITIDQMVNAIIDPEGADAGKLDAALRKQAGDDGKKDERDEATKALRTLLQRDESGLYGFWARVTPGSLQS